MRNAKVRTKTTFRVDPGLLTKFQGYMASFGLRRDKYLNMILPEAIRLLRQAERNSPTAEKFWKSMRDVRSGSLQKVAILLDGEVLADMNAACAEKRVPRDQFFQRVLESLFQTAPDGPAPLPRALELIENPWQDWGEETPFDQVIMPNFSEDDLREVLEESGLPRA